MLRVGDTILMGRFKNKRVKVKSIDYNEKGDLLINGRLLNSEYLNQIKELPSKKIFKRVKNPKLRVPSDIKKIHKLFKKNKKQLYIVGGVCS